MAVSTSNAVIALTAQALLVLALICCVFSAKLPPAANLNADQQQTSAQQPKSMESQQQQQVIPVSAGISRNSLPIIASTDDIEVVAHTGPEGLGRQKRYIGWGRRPSLRYSKATSTFDHDSLFNRIHNNFDKRGAGPGAPISSFRELRMKQKVPNIQLLLPHMPMRNTRVPDNGPEDDGPLEMDQPAIGGGKLTQEDLEALAYLLEGDIQ